MKLLTRCTILLICLLISCSKHVVAGNLEEIYLKAHAAYQAGDSAKALSLYQSIEPKGPAIWYNMGNCYFNQQQYADAIVAWRRAQKNLPWSDYKKLEQYIGDSYNALGVAYSTSGLTNLINFFLWLIYTVSLFIWQLLFLVLWIFLLWLLPRFIVQKRYLKLIGFCLITLAAGGICFARYYNQRYPYGIVTKKTISVYAGPGRDYASLATAHALDVMRSKDERDGWLKVHSSLFGYGWVQKEDLALI